MKKTIEIADPPRREARKLAAREHLTLRAMVERGPHNVVAEAGNGAPFKLRRAGFKGTGLRSELRDASWERLRDLACQDRGAPEFGSRSTG